MITHSPVPGVTRAFLTPGEYVFRLMTDEHLTERSAPRRVGPHHEELVLAFAPRPGLRLNGRVALPSGAGIGGALLHVRTWRDGAWLALPLKLTLQPQRPALNTTAAKQAMSVRVFIPFLLFLCFAADQLSRVRFLHKTNPVDGIHSNETI